MRIVFDNNMPVKLRKHLQGHLVMTARALGWQLLANGDLIKAGENAGFDVLLTGDKGIFYQQNNRNRKISLVVLGRLEFPLLLQNLDLILQAIGRCSPGSFEMIDIPSTAFGR